MVETCVLTLGELVDRKLQNDKKLDKNQCKTICKYFVCGEDKADKQYQLTIPDYQRAYVWDTERVKILLEDLDEQINKTNTSDKRLYKFLLGNLCLCTRIKNNQNVDKYLLGSLILCEGKDKNNTKVLEVVDGQQRLVTLALILLCLEKLTNENATIDFLKDSTFTHSESKKHIKENYDFIKSWFEARPDKHDKFKANLKDTIEFICILAPLLDDAFIFFDSVNAKGMRLEAYDLIKAFHLRALEDYSVKSKDSKSSFTAYFAKEFERLAKEKDGENLKILFNETLTPARQWLRYNSDKVSYQMDIYNEFCTEIPQRFKSSPLIAKDSLGILQNFVGGVDFFEFLSHFHRLYTQLQSVEFYKELEAIDWASGFIYNRYIYIMATLIYLDKFPNGRVDYMLRLIARAVFALRCSEERIYIQTARNFAKEILPLIYYASFEQELENELQKFIIRCKTNEKELYEKLPKDKKEIGGGGESYLKIAKEWYGGYYGESIPKHYKHLMEGNNE